MKSDIRGCSTCDLGQESYETYHSAIQKKDMVQYDFRTPEGKLFSTIAPSLEVCRARRDKWQKGGKAL
jgi:hypothetical protein